MTYIELHDLDGRLVRELPSKIGDVSWFAGSPDSDLAYYATHSYERPRQIYAVSMTTGDETLWYTQPALADFSKRETAFAALRCKRRASEAKSSCGWTGTRATWGAGS